MHWCSLAESAEGSQISVCIKITGRVCKTHNAGIHLKASVSIKYTDSSVSIRWRPEINLTLLGDWCYWLKLHIQIHCLKTPAPSQMHSHYMKPVLQYKSNSVTSPCGFEYNVIQGKWEMSVFLLKPVLL